MSKKVKHTQNKDKRDKRRIILFGAIMPAAFAVASLSASLPIMLNKLNNVEVEIEGDYKEEVNVSSVKTASGNLEITITPKVEDKALTDVKVKIGGQELAQAEYTFEQNKVTIEKNVLANHSGKVAVEPKLTDRAIQSISVSETTKEVKVDNTFSISAAIQYVEPDNKHVLASNANATIQWEISGEDGVIEFVNGKNTSVSNENIQIKGLKKGNATLTAKCIKDDTITSTCAVTVKGDEPVVQKIIVTGKHNIDFVDDASGTPLSITDESGTPISGATFQIQGDSVTVGDTGFVFPVQDHAGTSIITVNATGYESATFEVEVADFKYFDEESMKSKDWSGNDNGTLVAKSGADFPNRDIYLPNRYYDENYEAFNKQLILYPLESTTGNQIQTLYIPANIQRVDGNYYETQFNGVEIENFAMIDPNDTSILKVENKCVVDKETGKKIYLGCKNSTISTDIEIIGDFAFEGVQFVTPTLASNLTNLLEIGDHGFAWSNIIILNNTTSLRVLNDNAFKNCSSLQQVYVSNNKETEETAFFKIGAMCFANCPNLQEFSLAYTGVMWNMLGYNGVNYESDIWTPGDVGATATFIKDESNVNKSHFLIGNIYNFTNSGDGVSIGAGSTTKPFQPKYDTGGMATSIPVYFPNRYVSECSEYKNVVAIEQNGFADVKWFIDQQAYRPFIDLSCMQYCTTIGNYAFVKIQHLQAIIFSNKVTKMGENILSEASTLRAIYLTQFTSVPEDTWPATCFANIGSSSGNVFVASGTKAAWTTKLNAAGLDMDKWTIREQK